jgi:predicted acetyltransferase
VPATPTENDSLSAARPVTLEHATRDESVLLSNLLELYMHDLSAVFPIELGPDGRFGYARLPLYWSEPDKRYPFLIKCGGSVAGFALVTRGSPVTDDPTDLDVAEFFVLRRYRRSGVGRDAARALWDAIPGRWVVRVSEANHGALPFWFQVIEGYSSGAHTDTRRPGRPHGWRVFTFTSSPSGPDANGSR